jgi:hypothetical protein
VGHLYDKENLRLLNLRVNLSCLRKRKKKHKPHLRHLRRLRLNGYKMNPKESNLELLNRRLDFLNPVRFFR